MAKKVKDDVYMYVFARTDLESLNPGKMAAQACHAANQCVYEAASATNEETKALLKEWQASTGHGFGTTIVLGARIDTIRRVVALLQEEGIVSGVVHDPTYPLVDGEVLHLIPLDTCGFALGRKGDIQAITTRVRRNLKGDDELNLHP